MQDRISILGIYDAFCEKVFLRLWIVMAQESNFLFLTVQGQLSPHVQSEVGRWLRLIREDLIQQ
jgi:hypothetical protein